LILAGGILLFAGFLMPYAHISGYGDWKILDFTHYPRSVWFFQLGYVLGTLAVIGAAIWAFVRPATWLFAAVGAFMGFQALNWIGSFLASSVNGSFWGHPAWGLIFLFIGPACAVAGAILGILDLQGVFASSQPATTSGLAATAHGATPDTPGMAPAGWYPDPSGQAAQRYWDGTAWSEQVAS
jgi:hypothetical protein